MSDKTVSTSAAVIHQRSVGPGLVASFSFCRRSAIAASFLLRPFCLLSCGCAWRGDGCCDCPVSNAATRLARVTDQVYSNDIINQKSLRRVQTSKDISGVIISLNFNPEKSIKTLLNKVNKNSSEDETANLFYDIVHVEASTYAH